MNPFRSAVVVGVAPAVGALLLLATSCKHDEAADSKSGTAKTSLSSADVQASIDTAAEHIADARCEREVSCNQVAAAQHDAAIQTCRSTIKSELHKQLDLKSCPNGVNANKATTCASATVGAGCSNPIALLMKLEDCTAARMCF